MRRRNSIPGPVTYRIYYMDNDGQKRVVARGLRYHEAWRKAGKLEREYGVQMFEEPENVTRNPSRARTFVSSSRVYRLHFRDGSDRDSVLVAAGNETSAYAKFRRGVMSRFPGVEYLGMDVLSSKGEEEVILL